MSEKLPKSLITGKYETYRKVKDPWKYKKMVVNKCWAVIKKYLENEEVSEAKKVVIATQIALKDLSIEGSLKLQKLKGTQELAGQAFLVNALQKAEKLNKKIDKMKPDAVVINAGRNAELDMKYGVTEKEVGKLNKTYMPSFKPESRGKWLGDNKYGHQKLDVEYEALKPDRTGD